MDTLLVNTCRHCMYYNPKTEGEGYCHCNPPASDGFPPTSADAWCGKFVRRPSAPKETDLVE